MITYDHLIGRPFEHGRTDCYTMIQDFYRDNYGIELPNFARPDAWWDHGLNLYMDNLHATGFDIIDVPVRDYRIGDCFLMAIMAEVANHAAVHVGDGKILHHFYGRFSEVSLYKGVWRNATVAVVRHRLVKDLPVQMETMSLLDVVPEHLRNRYVNPESSEEV